MSTSTFRRAGALTTLALSGMVAGGLLVGNMSANAATSPAPSYSSTATGGSDTDTAVTGTEADNVKAAVVAAKPGTTVTTVQKDADGTYDVMGTDSAGTKVSYDVSSDLKTVTAKAGRGGHGGGKGGGSHTAVTGTEADNVKAAVVAAKPGTTVTTVQKDADGSYDVAGTDSTGAAVSYEVSSDLKTVTAKVKGDRGNRGAESGTTSSSTATPSA